MMVSQNLLQEIAGRNNCFRRKNLTHYFTADPFSATNTPRASDPGFTAPYLTALAPAPGADSGALTVLRLRAGYKRASKRVRPAASIKAALVTARVPGFKHAAMNARRSALLRAARRAARLTGPTA